MNTLFWVLYLKSGITLGSTIHNLACEQLIGHRVLISEEENYQKQVLIILVVITEIQGQAL